MQVSYCYKRSKVWLVTALMPFGVLMLELPFLMAPLSPWLMLVVNVPLILLLRHFILDGLLPAIRNEPVCFLDDEGFTDIISWGLIRWDNIADLRLEEVESKGYSFKVMLITLRDRYEYEGYRSSAWIRFKMRCIRILCGRSVDIRIDLDALDGNVDEVFDTIYKAYLHFRGW